MAKNDFQQPIRHKPNDAYIPALVNPPCVFIAPKERTVAGGEIWIAVSCNDNHYGGCIIYASTDGVGYTRMGQLSGNATHGIVTADLASANGTDVTHTLAVDVHLSGGVILGVNQTDVDTLDTLCYVGGEFLAFRDAQTTGVGLYNLSYLKRGLYGSTPGAANQSPFVLCNNALFRYRFNRNLLGKTIHLKFQGFNGVGRGLQDMADLVDYTFSVTHEGGVNVLDSDLIPIFNNLAVLNAQVLSIAINNQMVGTAPTLVASFRLPPGTYSAPSANIGCGDPAYSATLQLRNAVGAVLATLGGVGGLQWRTANAGFVLAEDTDVDVLLSSNNASAVAFIRGLSF